MAENEVTSRTEKIDDISLTAKLRTFTCNTASTLKFTFQNAEGLAYDLTGDDSEFKASIQEAVEGSRIYDLSVTRVDDEHGVLSVKIPGNLPPGIYRGSVKMVHDGSVVVSNPFRLYVASDMGNGIPSIAEIRMYLRDTYPEENYLLEGLEFQDTEIAMAVERAIRYFNEVPPHLDLFRATTNNFPWRYHLLEGVLGQLYRIAANSDRKNNLQYSAGGLSVNDVSKEQNYLQASQLHWQSYQQFVESKKYELNMLSFYAYIP